MELQQKDLIVLTLMLGLLVISFLSGSFVMKMQLNDEINSTREFCANMTERVNIYSIPFYENQEETQIDISLQQINPE